MRLPALVSRSIRSRNAAVVATFVVFFVANFLFLGLGSGKTVRQPVLFSHAKHIQNGMSCTDCHVGAQEQASATIPTIADCLNCHEAPLSESPEEAKIRSIAAAKQELLWSQITRVPPHVYFSHRRHVQLGKLTCDLCHGVMEKATVPPSRPFRPMTMDSCLECHQRHGLRSDCNDCHR